MWVNTSWIYATRFQWATITDVKVPKFWPIWTSHLLSFYRRENNFKLDIKNAERWDRYLKHFWLLDLNIFHYLTSAEASKQNNNQNYFYLIRQINITSRKYYSYILYTAFFCNSFMQNCFCISPFNPKASDKPEYVQFLKWGRWLFTCIFKWENWGLKTLFEGHKVA